MKSDASGIACAPILLVEDEPDLREDIAEELQAAGYCVTSCSNGEQALATLAIQRHDLILCDISMPIMDGYALLNTLHEQKPELADIPFVFLTAQASPGQIAQGKRAGADDYLVKPIDFDLMLATIEARLRQLNRLKNMRQDNEISSAPAPQQLDTIQGMLDSLAVSLIMLTAEGRISFVNKMASGCFGLQAGGSLSDLIQSTGIREAEQLRKAIQHVIEKKKISTIETTEQKGDATCCLALTRAGDGTQNLLITICALEQTDAKEQPPSHGTTNTEPVVSIIVSSMPSQRLQPPQELLQQLYDLTPAEARVAWAFTQGKRSDEIAAQFHISQTTIAFHKRNIFLKTQTNRQADLIALLLSLPLV